MKKVIVLVILLCSFLNAAKKETVNFKSLDNLLITADLYMIDNDINRAMIVLFHQARSSRGEYNEIALRLNKLGFNCMAVDLRSGKISNKVKNETFMRAAKLHKKTSYLNAQIDIIAALQYARGYSNKIITWGSSYSASLILKTIGEKPRYSKAILVFSPGEYFSKFDKPDDYIQSSASKLKMPVFITSARNEVEKWQNIYDVIDEKYRVGFIPKSVGHHGSSALWSKYSSSKEYWSAVERFLKTLKL